MTRMDIRGSLRKSEADLEKAPEERSSHLSTPALVPWPGKEETTGGYDRVVQHPLHLLREEKARGTYK